MVNIEYYHKSFSKLTQVIKERFDIPHIGAEITHKDHPKEEKVIRSTLRSKGFSSEDINQYKEIYKKSLGLWDLLAPAWIFNVMIMRYISIISKVSIINNHNKITKGVLNEIFMDSISEHLSFLLKDLEDYNSLRKRNDSDKRFTMDSEFNKLIQESLGRIMAFLFDDKLLNNPIVEREAKSVLSSLLYISNPSKELLDEKIQRIKDEILHYENLLQTKEEYIQLIIKDKPKEKLDIDRQIMALYEDILIHNRKLLSIYEEVRMTNN